jgi:hypothetical protein
MHSVTRFNHYVLYINEITENEMPRNAYEFDTGILCAGRRRMLVLLKVIRACMELDLKYHLNLSDGSPFKKWINLLLPRSTVKLREGIGIALVLGSQL